MRKASKPIKIMENKKESAKQAVTISRVSTFEQRDAGNSLPAQEARMVAYCESKKLDIIKKIEFDESAYKDKRDEFDNAIDFIKRQKERIAVCFDKTDRLSRNIFDKRVPLLYEMAIGGKIELHFASENLVISPEISASEKFHFGINLGLAKYYSDAISDNVKRAFEKMRAQGVKTGHAPLGYKNIQITNEDGKIIEKDILPDPQKAPLVIEAFKLFATGEYSVKTMTAYMKKKGLKGNKKGKTIAESMMHKILADPFYYGEMKCKGQLYPHKYKPLISKLLYEDVQDILHGRYKNRVQMTAKEFVFGKGLLTCKRCGCSYSGEEKKGKFIYYACTNSKNKCKRIYVPERELLESVRKVLAKLQLSDEKVQEVLKGLKKSTEHKSLFQKNEMARLRSKYDSLTEKMDRFLDLFGERGLTKEAYDKKIAECVQEQKEIEIELEGHTEANEDYLVTAGRILDLSKRALEIFDNPNSEPGEKRQLLSYLIQNPTMDGKKLMFTLRNPFNKVLLLNEHPIKLRGRDSNLQPSRYT